MVVLVVSELVYRFMIMVLVLYGVCPSVDIKLLVLLPNEVILLESFNINVKASNKMFSWVQSVGKHARYRQGYTSKHALVAGR